MIKKLVAVIIATLTTTALLGQGINFFEGSYDEALQEAQQHNKMIFVDVYTSWCMPCRMMSQKTFTDPKVGEYYNKNFISIKLDAEKQSDSSFFSSYQATSFPSYFWLSSNGELLLKDGAYMLPEPFLELTQEAVDSKFAENAKILEERWNSGERSIELLHEYVYKVVGTIDPSRVEAMVIDLLDSKSEEELRSSELYPVVISCVNRGFSDNKYSRLALLNAPYYQNYGQSSDYWSRMYRAIVRVGSVKRSHSIEEYEQHIALLDSVDSPLTAMYKEILTIEANIFDGNFSDVIPTIIPTIEKYGPQHDYLYKQLFYTLIIGDYFTHAPLVESEILSLREVAIRAMEASPCKENLIYIAATYAKAGEFDQAYQCLASLPFFGEPMLSNALYRRLNISFYGGEFRK